MRVQAVCLNCLYRKRAIVRFVPFVFKWGHGVHTQDWTTDYTKFLFFFLRAVRTYTHAYSAPQNR